MLVNLFTHINKKNHTFPSDDFKSDLIALPEFLTMGFAFVFLSNNKIMLNYLISKKIVYWCYYDLW